MTSEEIKNLKEQKLKYIARYHEIAKEDAMQHPEYLQWLNELDVKAETDGPICCDTNMVLAPSETCYECLVCGNWTYSSS